MKLKVHALRDVLYLSRAGVGRRLSAFSLVEILVVIAVLAILLGLVFKGGGGLLTKAKVDDTAALLDALDQAITAYKSEVDHTRIPNAGKLFGDAPPDMVHVFQDGGTRAFNSAGYQVAMVKQASLMDGTTALLDKALDDQRSPSGSLSPLDPDSRRYGDGRALVLALRLRSPKAKAILDQIDSRFLASGREENLFFDPNDGTDPIPLDYYVDAWGTPLEYYSLQADPTGGGGMALPRTPREAASADFLKANNGEPLLVSYGPDGADQFSQDFFADVGDTSLVADHAGDGLVNNVLNQDNIYSSDTFKERMMR